MTKKVYSIFPIEQDPSCLLKWNWSTIFFNSGSTASCHRTQKYKIDPDNFSQFHNLPDKIVAREKMLQGQWPGFGCEYCRLIEEHGGKSDRIMQLGLLKDQGLVPPELWNSTNQTEVTPTILEIYFNNTCNMKCVYCGPHYSSLWEDENKKFQHAFLNIANDQFGVTIPQYNPDYKRMIANLWEYLDVNNRYKILRRFHILGGEPFLIKEIDQCINFWAEHPNPDLTISIVTNLNIDHNRFTDYMSRFQTLVETGHIMTIQIVGSLDAWGPEQAYTRFGLDLDLWQRNFESIIDKPWVSCSINSALSALTIKQFPLLLEKINKWNIIRNNIAIDEFNSNIVHSFNYVKHNDDMFVFAHEVFEQDLRRALELFPDTSDIQREQKQAFKGIITAHSQSKNNLEKIQKLKSYLDVLDYRRGTNWRATFPWLNTDFNV